MHGCRRVWHAVAMAASDASGDADASRKRAFGIAGKIQLVGRIWICMSELRTRRRSLEPSPDTRLHAPSRSRRRQPFAPQAMTPAMTRKDHDGKGAHRRRKVISDAARRMAEAKAGRNAAGECQLQKPTYISRLLRRRRGSLPSCAAEAGGALGGCSGKIWGTETGAGIARNLACRPLFAPSAA